jgi:pimeloyl-ACP methyl ester carboxylesterase
VLVGHSIAGEELSSIGTRHPEKVAGLIYLDAGYPYALYDTSKGDFALDSMEFQQRLAQLLSDKAVNPKQSVQDLLSSIPQLQRDLQNHLKDLEAMPPQQPNQPPSPYQAAAAAIIAGEHKYTTVHVPCLAIFAVPHDPNSFPPMDASARAAAIARDLERTTSQSKAFQVQVPSAHVVRIPNANHYVFNSNEADVLREMNAFLETLP